MKNNRIPTPDYSTAKLAGAMVSFFGWIIFTLPLLASVSIFTGGGMGLESKLMTIAVAAGVSLGGLLVVAVGQITRAVVDIAISAREIANRMD
jgi:hypothetical protein